jgi:hypothetical protein
MSLNICSRSILSLLAAVSILAASSTYAQAPQSTLESSAAIEDAITRGTQLLDNSDQQAVGILGAAAQAALKELAQAPGGRELLTASPERIPERGSLAALANRAATAHYWWGMAAEKFAQRDTAFVALARAYRLAGPNRLNTNSLSRDTTFAIGSLTRNGLPTYAPDDAIDTLSTLSLWKPRRVRFNYSDIALNPPIPLRPGTSQLPATQELLITSGKVFPPENLTNNQNNNDKTVVAPLYRSIAADQLPGVLKLGYMIVGYVRESSGPNRGLWKQVVRVYYAHPVLTNNNRDDRARAEALCEQFLKLHTLTRLGLGLTNPYTADKVTSLWLSELSAIWPLDDEDPQVQAQLGVRMPKPNIPSGNQKQVRAEVEWSPQEMPWLAAGQVESAPGDIMFFKVGTERAEAEWLRQIAHEYGHVLLPPFGGFQPPLEPFGNGTIGETLSTVWAAAATPEFDIKVAPSTPIPALTSLADIRNQPGARTQPPTTRPATPPARPIPLRDALLNSVTRQAIPALRLFNAQGPNSPLLRDGSANGLRYLQGANLYLERVYGARILGMAHRPLQQRSASAYASLSRITPTNTTALLNTLPTVLRDPFLPGQKYFAVWLPGAIENLPANLPAQQVVRRAPLLLRRGETMTVKLFIPPTAKTLHVEWKGAAGSQLGARGWKSTARPAVAMGNNGAVDIDVTNRAAWQRLSLVPTNQITITNAWFEKR